jgi:hypothetical protein
VDAGSGTYFSCDIEETRCSPQARSYMRLDIMIERGIHSIYLCLYQTQLNYCGPHMRAADSLIGVSLSVQGAAQVRAYLGDRQLTVLSFEYIFLKHSSSRNTIGSCQW